ncbi:sigma-70 family RNA polymerase sigma factor [Sphingomonas sp. TREG-RG-20F-R18-01]|uniref:RNA polymerase sigma factor n=2 Tax=unclassified Sphingomonas TaxID=196159 RepID=UPI001F567F29|nr:sigma-70 family RNA polymerase sigma factor [Sphingomonas sp. TREG-RG-20F-R18-01]
MAAGHRSLMSLHHVRKIRRAANRGYARLGARTIAHTGVAAVPARRTALSRSCASGSMGRLTDMSNDMPDPVPASEPVDLLARLRDMRPAVLSFFVRRLHDQAQAEDLIQDLFVRIASMTSHPTGNPEGYIFQTAANLLRDHYRREATRSRYVQARTHDRDRDVDPIDAERLLLARQSVGCVAKTLEALPDRTRQIFILYRLEGMQRKAIADAFGVSVSAVEKHISNAMRALLADLEKAR